DQILDLAERDGSNTSLGFAHLAQVAAGYHCGDFVRVEEHFARFNEYLEAPGLNRFPGAIEIAYGYSTLAVWISGRADSGRERIDRAIALAVTRKSPFELAYAKYYESALYLELREFQRAEPAANQAVKLSEQHDFLYLKDETRMLLGRARAQPGNAGEAVSLIQRGLSERIKNGSRVGIGFWLMLLAEAQAVNRDVDEALATLERALDANQEIIWQPRLLSCRGELRLQLGRSELAEDDFREAVSLAKKVNAKTFEL